LVVVLSKAIEAKLNFVSGEGRAERGLTSRVARAVVISRADGIIWPAVEIGTVEVEKGETVNKSRGLKAWTQEKFRKASASRWTSRIAEDCWSGVFGIW